MITDAEALEGHVAQHETGVVEVAEGLRSKIKDQRLKSKDQRSNSKDPIQRSKIKWKQYHDRVDGDVVHGPRSEAAWSFIIFEFRVKNFSK